MYQACIHLSVHHITQRKNSRKGEAIKIIKPVMRHRLSGSRRTNQKNRLLIVPVDDIHYVVCDICTKVHGCIKGADTRILPIHQRG